MNPDIYREIKRRILFLEYEPGQILNENVLAREFGVSRTPMREVLYRLSWEQLARIIARTGTMVTQIEFSDHDAHLPGPTGHRRGGGPALRRTGH
jgi:DNA-binding GntR family transcriptional regulator